MVSTSWNTKHGKWAWMALLILGFFWVEKGRLLKMSISCNVKMTEWSKEGLNEVKCCFTADFSGRRTPTHGTGPVCDQVLITWLLFGV